MIIDNAFDCIAEELTLWDCRHKWGQDEKSTFVLLIGFLGLAAAGSGDAATLPADG